MKFELSVIAAECIKKLVAAYTIILTTGRQDKSGENNAHRSSTLMICLQ